MSRSAVETLDHLDHLLTKTAGRAGVTDVDVRQGDRWIVQACAYVQMDDDAVRLAGECRKAISTFMNSRCWTPDPLRLMRPVDTVKQAAAGNAYRALRRKLEALPPTQAAVDIGLE